MNTRVYFALVLHAHLPYVHHPDSPRLEQHWLYQAILDCYLPLTRVLIDAHERGCAFALTLSVSPTLLAMLNAPDLPARLDDYGGRLVELCRRQVADPTIEPRCRALARLYGRHFASTRRWFCDRLGCNLIGAWSDLARSGRIELITTAATHGYLPLLRAEPSAVRAQLRVGRDYFTDRFGRQPTGLWLPECGYYPGLERELAAAGYRYCVLDSHALLGRDEPGHGVHAPVDIGEQVAAFARDPESARDIWCTETGFPSHPAYRDYHRDLGYDADPDKLDGFFPAGVEAAPTGIKYHRVTERGECGANALYEPHAALRQAKRDAERFVANRLRCARSTRPPPLVVAPYDAELFGHWWFEGPVFIGHLIEQIEQAGSIEPITLGGYLERFGTAEDCTPASSSWGEHGYNRTWLREETGWMQLQLHRAAVDLRRLVKRYAVGGDEFVGRLLRQAARSVLLAQGSDWTFHLGRSGASDYARARLTEQLSRFRYLAKLLEGEIEPEEARLAALESIDNLFPHLELNHFR